NCFSNHQYLHSFPTRRSSDLVITEKWSAEIGKNDFTVPTGYFDKLSENVLAKTVQPTKEETTIISLPRRTNWKKYNGSFLFSRLDRKSTRLNSSHVKISYAVF